MNGAVLFSNSLNFKHNSSGPLGITLPLDASDPQNNPQQIQLVDLAADRNYTATDATCPGSPNPAPSSSPNLTSACFSAGAVAGNPITWTASLQYATSGGFGPISDSRGPFTTASGAMHNEVYQNEGGQVQVTATTTASDGNTVKDCATFYIEGPAGGIANSLITNQLEQSGQSYLKSSSYPTGGTPALMAQVAVYESNYAQFLEPPQPPKNVDLYKLYANSNNAIAAKWPLEGKLDSGLSDGGSHIGLIQTMTDPNQTLDANAWNWSTNGSDGVNLFSGTPPSEYSDAENKIQHATDYENIMIQGYIPGPPPSLKLPPLSGSNLENMALVLYGPAASNDPTRQYYIPVCLPPGTAVYTSATSTHTCVGGTWQWAVNSTGNPGGVKYADGVRAKTVPQ